MSSYGHGAPNARFVGRALNFEGSLPPGKGVCVKRKTSVLVAIILVAALVRAYGLFAFPFEQDELYTVDEATNLFHTKLLPGIQARPVFFLMEHPIMVSLPHTPVVLRAIPFIFGILGI